MIHKIEKERVASLPTIDVINKTQEKVSSDGKLTFYYQVLNCCLLYQNTLVIMNRILMEASRYVMRSCKKIEYGDTDILW